MPKNSGPAVRNHVAPLVPAILGGGPRDIPAAVGTCSVPVTAASIKVERLGGYEHFERQDEPGTPADRPVRFRWVVRTRMAE